MSEGEASEQSRAFVAALLAAHGVALAAAGPDREAVLAEFFNPDVEFRPYSDLLGRQASYTGHQGMAEYFDDMAESWTTFGFEVETVEDAGEGRILVIGEQHGTGRASGVEIEGMNLAGLIDVRDGRVARLLGFATREDARRAAGNAD